MFSFMSGRIVALLFVFASAKAVTIPRLDYSMIDFDVFDVIASELDAFNVTAGCKSDLESLIDGLFRKEIWALKMIDASSKIPSGLLGGNIRDLGMYDECVGIRAEENSAHIRGRHCMVSWLRIPISAVYLVDGTETKLKRPDDGAEAHNMAVSSGICVPSQCAEEDIVELGNAIAKKISFDLNLRPSDLRCSPLASSDLSTGEILTITFLAVVVFILLLATACDYLLMRKMIRETRSTVTFARFSTIRSAIALFSTKVSANTMSSINGIRALSIIWVVFGHTYFIVEQTPQVNNAWIVDWRTRWSATIVESAPLSVDTFFLMSGFLFTFMFLKYMRSGGKLNIPVMYLHRYIRLTPSVVAVVLFSVFLLPRLGSGPRWLDAMESYTGHCGNKWWINFLYLQNHLLTTNCIQHGWYLAADMQMFWVSPFIVYVLHRWPKRGFVLLWLCLVVSIIIPAVIVGVYKYTSEHLSLKYSPAKSLEQYEREYTPAYCRMTPYLIGIFLGYEMVAEKRKLTQMRVTIAWLIWIALMFYCFSIVRPVYEQDYVYNVYFEIFYLISVRLCWPISIAWLIYACTHGYGGPVAKFLSLPIFVPLGRLSYCIYLTHIGYQLSESGTVMTAEYGSEYRMFLKFLGDFIMSLASAVVLSLCFESPFIILEKILFNTDDMKTKLSRASLKSGSSDENGYKV